MHTMYSRARNSEDKVKPPHADPSVCMRMTHPRAHFIMSVPTDTAPHAHLLVLFMKYSVKTQ